MILKMSHNATTSPLEETTEKHTPQYPAPTPCQRLLPPPIVLTGKDVNDLSKLLEAVSSKKGIQVKKMNYQICTSCSY